MTPRMRASPVIDALKAAVTARAGNVTGVIFHSTVGPAHLGRIRAGL